MAFSCIVLGCGRSGTSMIASLLSKCDYFFGDDLIGADLANPNGYFESIGINKINEDILSRYVPQRLPRPFINLINTRYPVEWQRWLAILDPSINLNCSASLSDRIQRCIPQRLFCFKDPRFSYTLPCWMPYLSEDIRYVCVFRDPAATASSLVKEASRDALMRRVRFHFTLDSAYKLWLNTYKSILRLYEEDINKEHWLFLDYQSCISYESLPCLSEHLGGIPLDSQIINHSYNRSRSIIGPTGNVEVSNLYQRLLSLSGASIDASKV